MLSLYHRIRKRVNTLIFGPPVRNRIVIEVLNGSAPTQLAPGFLVGVYRSGTTLLRYILDSHSNIAVPPETNFLYVLTDLWRCDWIKKGLQGAGVDEKGLLHRLRDFTAGVYDDYATAKGKARWIDKTPAYIDVLDFIDALFGDRCRYIMVYRHGLDVANSLAIAYRSGGLGGPVKQYADAFENSPFLTFVRYWSEQCEKMLEFEKTRENQCFRAYYEDFATKPDFFLPPLFDFLGEPWEPEVLRFDEKPHDFGFQDDTILETKGFRPSIGNYRDLDKKELEVAGQIAERTMRKLGYTF